MFGFPFGTCIEHTPVESLTECVCCGIEECYWQI